MNILTLNSGSTSLKFAVFDGEREDLVELASGDIEETGGEALSLVLARFTELRLPPPAIIGHRVVHGGRAHRTPVWVDDALVRELRALVELAPLHMPPAIAMIEAAGASYPDARQVVCFDTAFHADLPERAARLPIPRRFHDVGVRRYGFHGLSFEYVMSVLGQQAPSRIILAHLGGGSSLVAIRDGRPIDTTMGFTPAGGIMMGTRTGDIDPGALFYIARKHGLALDAVEDLVLHDSGLRGIAGTSDLRELVRRSAHDAEARLAVDMFAYGVKKAIGGFAAALGGLDLLVFTGGIGSNAAAVRRDACEGLGMFGITLDDARNEQSDDVISAAASRVLVRVIATDENRQIASLARTLRRG